jgi:hypothetical protein
MQLLRIAGNSQIGCVATVYSKKIAVKWQKYFFYIAVLYWNRVGLSDWE